MSASLPSGRRSRTRGTPASSPSVGTRSAGCTPSAPAYAGVDTFTEQQRAAQQHVRSLIWNFYADLKAYRTNPTPRPVSSLATREISEVQVM